MHISKLAHELRLDQIMCEPWYNTSKQLLTLAQYDLPLGMCLDFQFRISYRGPF